MVQWEMPTQNCWGDHKISPTLKVTTRFQYIDLRFAPSFHIFSLKKARRFRNVEDLLKMWDEECAKIPKGTLHSWFDNWFVRLRRKILRKNIIIISSFGFWVSMWIFIKSTVSKKCRNFMISWKRLLLVSFPKIVVSINLFLSTKCQILPLFPAKWVYPKWANIYFFCIGWMLQLCSKFLFYRMLADTLICKTFSFGNDMKHKLLIKKQLKEVKWMRSIHNIFLYSRLSRKWNPRRRHR